MGFIIVAQFLLRPVESWMVGASWAEVANLKTWLLSKPLPKV